MAPTTTKKQSKSTARKMTPIPNTTGRNHQSITNRRTDELVAKLHSTVEDLVSKLAQQKYENANLETKIREEVYNEYVKLHDDLHRRYSVEKREAIQDVVELAEDRMELFKKYADGADVNVSDDSTTVVTAEQAMAAMTLQDDVDGRYRRRTSYAIEQQRKSCSVQTDQIPTGDDKEVKRLRKMLDKKEKRIRDLEETLTEAATKFTQMEREQQDLLATIARLEAAQNMDINSNNLLQQGKFRPSRTPSPTDQSDDQQVQATPGAPVQVDNEADWESDDAAEKDESNKTGTTGIPKDPTPASGQSSRKRRSIRRRSMKKKRPSLSVLTLRRTIKHRSLTRKPFHTVVKLNRAYLLKMQASPILLHDHETGVTYDSKSITKNTVKKLQF